MLRFLFPAGLFLSAVLLFSIQPMVAKALLPVYGGTPGVWIVCMLFFQIVLLVAYGYVWLLSLLNKPTWWRLTHFIVVALSLAALPLLFHPSIISGAPEQDILIALLTQIGLPLLVIGASAPLLQYAYSQTNNKKASDPYFLYAASNLGSLVALLVYPWAIERFIGLKYQFHLWTTGYLVYCSLLVFILSISRYKPVERDVNFSETAPVWRDMLYWVYLSFVPCSLMFGVTLYITTDIAPTPLFWVLPLAIYLFSFIISFTEKPLIAQSWIARNCVFVLMATVLVFVLAVIQLPVWIVILIHLSNFFMLAVLCHGALFLARPKPEYLTLFYFFLALGGVIAGVFNGILAPHWFNQVYEYPLIIVLSILVIPKPNLSRARGGAFVVLGLLLLSYFLPETYGPKGLTTVQFGTVIASLVVVLWYKNKFDLFLSVFILFVFICSPVFKKDLILLQERNFYGVKQVLNKEGTHVLISQSTVHGLQPLDKNLSLSGETSYYGSVKHVIKEMQQSSGSLRVALLGLGAGTVICQFRQSDYVQAIEIDQQMIDLAKNGALFTYLYDCLPHIDIIRNDGRLSLAKMNDSSQDLIILDAFNSDSVPVHLMTLEAFSLYTKKLSSSGAILVNLSNRHLELLPVVNAIGRSLGLMVFYIAHKGDPKLGQFDSKWALLTVNEHLAFEVMKRSGWRFLADNKQYLWTDDYSNIVPLLR